MNRLWQLFRHAVIDHHIRPIRIFERLLLTVSTPGFLVLLACSCSGGGSSGVVQEGLDCANGVFFWDGEVFESCDQCPENICLGIITERDTRGVVIGEGLSLVCAGQRRRILNGECNDRVYSGGNRWSGGSRSGGGAAGVAKEGLDCADGTFFWDGEVFESCDQCPDDQDTFPTCFAFFHSRGAPTLSSEMAEGVTAQCAGQSRTILDGECNEAWYGWW